MSEWGNTFSCTASWQTGFKDLYLSHQEVHVLLNEHIQLFLQDCLHFFLALAAQVGWSLTHASCNQSIALIGNLAGQIAGGLVDLSSLQDDGKLNECIAASLFIVMSALLMFIPMNVMLH